MSRFRVAGALTVLALVFLAAAPVRAAGVPVISEISEITIHTSSGTWAYTNTHDETIRHVDGAFVRSDAVVLRDADVQRLLDALARPSVATVSPGRMGFDREYLLANLDYAEVFLGDAVSLPAARATFDAMFLDSAAMQRSSRSGRNGTGRSLEPRRTRDSQRSACSSTRTGASITARTCSPPSSCSGVALSSSFPRTRSQCMLLRKRSAICDRRR